MKMNERKAVQKAIRESELNGYKWAVTSSGLKWNYLDVEFQFEQIECEFGDVILKTVDEHGHTFATILVSSEFYGDCATIEEGYEKLTKQTIKKANYIY